MVGYSDKSTDAVHEAKIPAEYYRHLIWIQSDSMGSLSYSRWLQTVIDCFVDELRESLPEVPPSWRSAVLNPLLTRAFYGIQGDDGKMLLKAATSLLEKKSLNVNDFAHFYTRCDVINKGYDGRWDALEAQAIALRGRNAQVQKVPGTASASPSHCQQPFTLSPSSRKQEQ